MSEGEGYRHGEHQRRVEAVMRGDEHDVARLTVLDVEARLSSSPLAAAVGGVALAGYSYTVTIEGDSPHRVAALLAELHRRDTIRVIGPMVLHAPCTLLLAEAANGAPMADFRLGADGREFLAREVGLRGQSESAFALYGLGHVITDDCSGDDGTGDHAARVHDGERAGPPVQYGPADGFDYSAVDPDQ